MSGESAPFKRSGVYSKSRHLRKYLGLKTYKKCDVKLFDKHSPKVVKLQNATAIFLIIYITNKNNEQIKNHIQKENHVVTLIRRVQSTMKIFQERKFSVIIG